VSVSKEIVRLEHSAVKLTITVSKDDAVSQYNELIKEYLKSAVIPGFRKGKVPREVLERKYGAGLKEEALNKIANKALTDVFEDEAFPKEDVPLRFSLPRLDPEPVLDFDKDFVFSVVYDVLPPVTVGPWKGLEVEIPNVEVGSEDITRELKEIQERNAIVQDKDDKAAAAKDDVVTINYCELDAEGNPIEESKREDFVFTLGSGYNLYQLDDDMIGMKKGETKDIKKTFPADYQYSELAGKTVTIQVALTAVKEKKLPALDDELAQDVDEKYKTLEDLKNNIREGLNKNLEIRLRDITVSKILEKVMDTTPIELPESMVRVELDSRFMNLARQNRTNTEEMAKYLLAMGQDPQTLKAEWKPEAEKALKSRLIVETLIKDLKLEAAQEEIDKQIEEMTAGARNSDEAEQMKKYYQQENTREYLEESIKERKLYDLFKAENKIKKGKKESYLDIMSNYR
jgi:trigger factor